MSVEVKIANIQLTLNREAMMMIESFYLSGSIDNDQDEELDLA